MGIFYIDLVFGEAPAGFYWCHGGGGWSDYVLTVCGQTLSDSVSGITANQQYSQTDKGYQFSQCLDYIIERAKL